MSSTPSASNVQSGLSKSERLMEEYYGNFIEQIDKTWIPKIPESLMSNRELGVALMGQTYALRTTFELGTDTDMHDEDLRKRLTELAQRGPECIVVFFNLTHLTVFRFVEFDQQDAWKLGTGLGISDLRKLDRSKIPEDNYAVIRDPGSPEGRVKAASAEGTQTVEST